MKDCFRFRPLLALNAGGDLPADESRRVSEHVARCWTCTEEEARFRQIIEVAALSGLAEHQMPSGMRLSIALEAAERATRRPWLALRGLWLSQRPGLVASLAAVLLALVALPLAFRNGVTPARQEGPMRIDVVARSGAVHLAWQDGERDTYTVYKSTDPRSLASAEAHVVTGNVWTDPRPESAPIVFYRIEPGDGS